MSLGVALVGLGGVVNLVFLQVSPKCMTIFPMLPDPIPYLESESLLIQRCFRFLVSCFLITFSNLSNFLLNCTKDCFMGMGSWRRGNRIFPFRLSQNVGNREYCVLCTSPHASCTGRNVSRCVPFLGLWDSQYQVTLYPSSCHAKVSHCERVGLLGSFLATLLAVRSFFVARSIGLIGYFLATYALDCLKRQKEQTHVYRSPTFLVKVELILPRVRARL
jgi:hypothetical protein